MGIVIFFVGPGASELNARVFGSLLAEVKQVSIDEFTAIVSLHESVFVLYRGLPGSALP
jgi:hypothetical protein